MHRQLLTVEINLILGLVVTTADVHLGHPFHGQQLTFQTGCYAIGHRHIVSVYLKVGTCLSRHTCITTSQNNLCLAELRITFQVLTHLVTDCFQWDITISRVYQTDVEGNNVRAVVLHGSPRIIRVRLTYGIVTYLHDIFILRQPLVSQLLGKFLSNLFSCTDRQFKLNSNTGIILCREELRTDSFRTQQADNEESNTSHNHNRTMTNCPVQHFRITCIECVQRFLYRSKEELEHLRRPLLQTK